MAQPAFIYAFDNLGPYRFTELCGDLLGKRYKGFLLGGVGSDGGIDGEIDHIIGEWRSESTYPLISELIQPGQLVVFQFKHKVTARVGQTNARTQLLDLYTCNPKAKKTCELHSSLIQEKRPIAYILMTNVEVNAKFRESFIQRCKNEKHPSIKHYQVIGLDELETWIKMEPELRHLYFPTIFGTPRFDLRLAFSHSFPAYNSSHFSIPFPDFDTPMLCISILNVGVIASYINSIGFFLLVDGKTGSYNLFDFGQTLMSHANPRLGTPLEPGRRHTYNYPMADLGKGMKSLGKNVFPIGMQVEDEIGNIYRESFSDEMVKELLKYIC